MRDSREQLEKVLELMGEGSTRRIRLAVLAALVLSGMALHGLAWWYKVQAVSEEWAVAAVQFWPFAIGIWILTLGVLSAVLWRRLKGMSGRGPR